MKAIFDTAIANGLQRLIVLSLPGTPAADTMKLTVSVWCETLWPTCTWIDSDVQRIETAFRSLCRHAERWPTPKQFLDCLPQRKPLTALRPPGLTEEERARGREKVSRMLATLVRKKTGPIEGKRQGVEQDAASNAMPSNGGGAG